MTRDFLILVPFLALWVGNSFADTRDQRTDRGWTGENCVGFGGLQEDVCHVSFEELVANADRLDGRYVSIGGFLARGEVWILFSSEEAYKTADLRRGLRIQGDFSAAYPLPLVSIDRQHVGVVGVFSRDQYTWGGELTFGSLKEVARVGRRSVPWGLLSPPPKPPSSNGTD